MIKKPELFYILPTYGQFDYARKCSESFIRNTPAEIAHIAVIDDGSLDWYQQDLRTWPAMSTSFTHYDEQDGLTRSWNMGLRMARDFGFEYAICGNSDLLFTEDWWAPLKHALNSGFHLVGPVTNAPGHATWQRIQGICAFRLTDDRDYLNKAARIVRGYRSDAGIPCSFVNGFCMAAKTETWWQGAYDTANVFNPKYKLTGNEDELQNRWRKHGFKIGYVPQSFIFHYRSVSRPDALTNSASKGAFRDESISGNDRVHKDEHLRSVDACVAERGEVSGCQTSDHT